MLVCACATLLMAGAAGQMLLTLHVRAFSMSLDKAKVHVGEPFHLSIDAHVDQTLLQLDNVTLPDLSGFEVAGDERRCSTSGRGTDCVEILTLDAVEPGLHTLAPTTMDAVDARDGKPSRFLTNPVSIEVVPAAPLSNGLPPQLREVLLGMLRQILLLLVALAALASALWVLLRRRPRSPVPLLPGSAPAHAASDGASWRSLLASLAAEPTRPRVVAVREALRRRVGAREEETLSDLLARPAAGADDGVRAALKALERAAFCEDAQVVEAVREGLPLLHRLDAGA
jgi:hypothetical protein